MTVSEISGLTDDRIGPVTGMIGHEISTENSRCGEYPLTLPCRRTRCENWPTGANDCFDHSAPLAEYQVFQIVIVNKGHEGADHQRQPLGNWIAMSTLCWSIRFLQSQDATRSRHVNQSRHIKRLCCSQKVSGRAAVAVSSDWVVAYHRLS
jgi:hypothetical protein